MYQERLLTNIFHIQPGHNLCFPVPYAYTMCPDSYFIVFYNYFSNSLTFLSICCCGKIIDYNTISVSIITCNLQIQSFNVLSYNCFRFNINIHPCKKNLVWYLVFMFIVILIVPPFKGTTGNGQ